MGGLRRRRRKVLEKTAKDRKIGWPRPEKTWDAVKTLFTEDVDPKEEWLTGATKEGLRRFRQAALIGRCLYLLEFTGP